jgi:hypothetical protein
MINHRGHREHGVKEFAGGYIKTSEGVVKDRGVGAHLKRHAGAYTGTLIAPVLGTGVGALIDVARKRPNIVKTSEMEPAVSDKTAALLGLRGPVLMSANLKPALREFGSSGLARLGRVQAALARIDDSLSLRQGALAKHGGGPGGWASVKASRDSLKQQQRAQLSKFRQKLNQSELRYEQYPPDFHPSFGSGPQIGWGPAFADYPKFPRDKKYNLDASLAPALRELAARSGRIVEFGDGAADEAVIAALKAAASADESPAQRAMLLKRGLIEMVKGQLVINERGYDLMKKAGMPPKLTPEERREEIAGTEEKRLSRFEFARGDYAIPFLKNALQSMKGQNPPAWAARRSFPPRDGYTQLTPIPNPVQEALNWSGSLKKPSKRWSGDLIDPHPIFSGQKRTNPIRKDVAQLIKQIRNNNTPLPLSDAAYARAGQERTWGFRF